MNYPTFLKEVDKTAKLCDIENLRAFVHEMARTLSEEKRERFLSVLAGFSDPEMKNETKPGRRDDNLQEDVEEAMENLEEIRNEERYIRCDYNEEWDDWNGDEEDQFDFSDPEDVLEDIDEAVALLSKCIDRAEYEKGAELAEKLSSLNAPVSGDYDYSSIDIRDMILFNLIDVDMETLLKESLYLVCMGKKDEERAEAMVRIMENLKNYCITLEDILETGDDEIDVNSILPSWIEALSRREGKAVDKLLEEALGMLEKPEDILLTASRYAQSHPVLYLAILRNGLGKKSAHDMVEIGMRALKEVPVESGERSEIALRTAGYALKKGDDDIVETCWLEAFRSTPDVVNFLRLRLLSKRFDENREEIRKAYMSHKYSFLYFDKPPRPMVMFFDSRFEEMIERYMNTDSGLGWSSTFMKEGIALLLLLLSAGADGKGIKAMESIAFNASAFKGNEYTLGTGLKRHGTDMEMFLKCFKEWKANITLDDSVCELWISKIEQWLLLRTEGIMGADRRNYYGECASFIAALGEVEESRGRKSWKQVLMEGYRTMYSRRRAFISELVSYGMRK